MRPGPSEKQSRGEQLAGTVKKAGEISQAVVRKNSYCVIDQKDNENIYLTASGPQKSGTSYVGKLRFL